MMAARPVGCIIALLLLIMATAACVSPSIGEAVYRDGGIAVQVSNPGEPEGGNIQVKIFRISGSEQRELELLQEPVILARGGNAYVIPVRLEPGTYKLYVYLTVNDVRTTAVIRDIVV